MKWEIWELESEAVVKALKDDELIDTHHLARGKMSYYNAAEGSSWHKEADDRAYVETRLKWLGTELRERKLEPKPGQFLS